MLGGGFLGGSCFRLSTYKVKPDEQIILSFQLNSSTVIEALKASEETATFRFSKKIEDCELRKRCNFLFSLKHLVNYTANKLMCLRASR